MNFWLCRNPAACAICEELKHAYHLGLTRRQRAGVMPICCLKARWKAASD